MSNALLEENEQQTSGGERWSVAEAQKNGKPLLIRYRSERPQGVESASYPYLLSATWAYRAANPAGLPSEQELESMSRFEDALVATLESSQSAYLLVVLTANGERDWLWYSRGEEDSMRQVNKALKGHKTYPVQFSVQRDPNWRAYGQFVNGGDASSSAGGLASIVRWTITKATKLFCR